MEFIIELVLFACLLIISSKIGLDLDIYTTFYNIFPKSKMKMIDETGTGMNI